MRSAPVNLAASDLTGSRGLEALRVAAADRDPRAIGKTASQFESLFAQQLVKSMRQAGVGDPLFPGQSQVYRDLYDQEIAKRLTQGKGLGLQPMIRRALGETGPAPATAATAPPRAMSLAGYARTLPAQHALPAAAPAADAAKADASPSPAAAQGLPVHQRQHKTVFSTGSGPVPPHDRDAPPPSRASQSAPNRLSFRSREQFVAEVWPHAERAAAELGVSAKALVAQAALETGWGRHTGGANNLFGIKATGGWRGASARCATQEFSGGAMRRETAAFRSYDSVGDSFADYVRLLKSNPRYAKALEAGTDHVRFAHALQKAGYATDPAYGAKIASIAANPAFEVALQNPRDLPLLAGR